MHMTNGLLSSQEKAKHKVFVSFHHDDQYYRNEFDRLFGEHFISVSVDPGDIDPENRDEYIKKLIQQENIVQSSVIFVLYGAETYKRKHVDWEISAALSEKVGGHKGLVVMLLPVFPKVPYNALSQYDPTLIYPYLHPRTAANIRSGHAELCFWPGLYTGYPGVAPVLMPTLIEKAFVKRDKQAHSIDNSEPQYRNNRP
jgi:Thoeris protein ThsB, TIR-like domain